MIYTGKRTTMREMIENLVEVARIFDPGVHLMPFAGLCLLIIAGSGWYMAIRRIRRSPKFKIRLMLVFSMPFLTGLMCFWPNLVPQVYLVLYMFAFFYLLMNLYKREILNLSDFVQEQKEIFAQFLELLPDMVWVKDSAGRYTFANEALTSSLIVCDPKEIFGKTDPELTEMHMARGRDYPIQDLFSKDNGLVEGHDLCQQPMVLRVYRAPIYIRTTDGGSRFWGVVGIGQDLTAEHLEHQNLDRVLADGHVESARKLLQAHMKNM